MSLTTLSISCVYYDTEEDIFTKTLESLLNALRFCHEKLSNFSYKIYLINNASSKTVFNNSVNFLTTEAANYIIFQDHGNIGYGQGNNLAIDDTNSQYHLILNPDVILKADCLFEAIAYLDSNPHVGLIAPKCTNSTGEVEYLAKRKPTFSIIVLRGLNKPFLNKLFAKKLSRYTYSNELPTEGHKEIEIASGCFMFCRTSYLKQVNGFTDKYFLYFEDFDLSLKIRSLAKLHYYTKVEIIHHGGNAAHKGATHILRFLKSFFLFWRLNRRHMPTDIT